MKWMIRYWNQNRGKIILIIALVAFVFILIQITNSIIGKDKTGSSNEVVDRFEPTESVITGEKTTTEETKVSTDIIEKFVQSCNNKDYQTAFNLLSDDCKKEYGNDINKFISNYYNYVFTQKRTYNLELWLNYSNVYTYKITYYADNLLATGGTGITNDNREDYITVIQDDDNTKLNVNSFIANENINKSAKENNVEIIINSKKTYKNYEEYSITIKNYSDKSIKIADENDSKSICLVDKKNVEYSSFINEIPAEILSLKSGYQRNITIRFNKIYDFSRVIQKMKFANIILDADTYLQNPNDTQIGKMELNIDI